MKQFLQLVAAALLGGLVSALVMYRTLPSLAVVPSTAAQLVHQLGSYAPAPGFDFKEAARRSIPSVVHISTRQSGTPLDFMRDRSFNSPFSREGAGSGVIYSSDGYIVTNSHVVASSDEITVTLADNREFVGVVVGTDKQSDLAVIKIDATNLPTLQLADSDAAAIGEWVLAVGNPLELTNTVTAGIISAKGRSLHLLDPEGIESFIQTDAAVNPGNSGGALVDTEGQLLGINTAIATRTGMFQGYSFAIPVKLVRRVVDDIIQYGSFQRAYLGVDIFPLDAEIIAELKVPFSQGVVIDRVIDGSSAQYAGLRRYDIILKIGDRNIRDIPDLTEIVGRAQVGDSLRVVVWRNGEEVTVNVRMRADP